MSSPTLSQPSSSFLDFASISSCMLSVSPGRLAASVGTRGPGLSGSSSPEARQHNESFLWEHYMHHHQQDSTKGDLERTGS